MAVPCVRFSRNLSLEILPVSVTHRGNPIPDAAISVITGDPNAPPVLIARTDENGVVKIKNIAPGDYYLIASHSGIEAGRERIKVDPTARKTKKAFHFHWADDSYEVGRVSGVLTGLEKGNTGSETEYELKMKGNFLVCSQSLEIQSRRSLVFVFSLTTAYIRKLRTVV